MAGGGRIGRREEGAGRGVGWEGERVRIDRKRSEVEGGVSGDRQEEG